MGRHTNVKSWNAEIQDWLHKTTPEKYFMFLRKLVLDALTSIVNNTRWLTGRARGNWQVTIDQPTQGILETEDPNGSATIAKGVAAMQALSQFEEMGKSIFISNNVKYILKLEEMDGMVALTVARMEHLF